MSVLLSLCLFALSSTSALAANHYIRDGASGDGSDWNNAWDDLPNSLVRGDTYYIADGDYGCRHVFNDAESGSTYIYIKKAIVSDHGTNTGWQNSFGDGVANFKATSIDDHFEFHTGYYQIDGQVGGGPGSWTSGHGFAFKTNGSMNNANYQGFIRIGDGWSDNYIPHYITITHCNMTTIDSGMNANDGDYLIYQFFNDEYLDHGDHNHGPHNITISYCYLHDVHRMIISADAQNWTIEYTYFARNDTLPPTSNQGEAWKAFGDDGHTIRYNIFEDIDGTGVIVLAFTTNGSWYYEPRDWEIYGNVFFYTDNQAQPFNGLGGNGAIAGGDIPGSLGFRNIKIYNNTFINLWGYNSGVYLDEDSTGCVAYNNTFFNCNSSSPLMRHWWDGFDTVNYNWYADCILMGNNQDAALAAAETYGQHGAGDPFVNWQGKDFRLKSPTNRGLTLAAPYNTDLIGNTRGEDDNWDRGAYEYVGSQPAPQSPNADAGSDQTLTDSDENGSEDVNLNGNGSTDPDGSIVRYEWSKYINGIRTVIARDVIPTATVSLTPGKHNIELTVTDNSDLNDTDTVVIIVESEPGLAGHWKFDEGSGTIATDSTGISDAGRLINGPTWTTQGEINFDGSNDAVEVNTSDMTANEGTVSLWVYPESFSKSKHILFGHTTIPSSNIIQLYCNASGMLGVGLGNNSTLRSDIQALNAQEWYHVALAWNGTTYAVFVDGARKASGAYSGLNSLQTYADIGNSGNRAGRTDGFDGLIDEVRLYNRMLDVNEIANLALVFLPIGDKTAAEGEELGFTIRTKPDVNVDIPDTLPYNATISSNTFSWTPDYYDAGTYQVEFTATNSSGREDYETVTITVLDTQQQEPIGHWRFDETGGEIAYDSSTSGNNGYLKNGLVWDPAGKINRALVFSVPNDAVEIRTTNFNTAGGTISMWVYVEKQTLSRHYLFGHANESLQNRIQLYLKYGNLCVGLGDSHDILKNMPPLQLQNQRWYHIALTWNQTAYRLYVDGTSRALGTYSGLTGFADHADIGNNGIYRDKALNGKIDDVRIYNRVLIADEIAELAVDMPQ